MRDEPRRIAQLEDRLKAFELELHRARRRGHAAVVGILSLLIIGAFEASRPAAQSTSRTVRTPFEVVTDTGRTVLRVDDEGWLLFGSGGRPLAGARVEDGKGTLQVGHANLSGSFAQLTFSDEGRPTLELLTKNQAVATLQATEESARLELTTPGGKPFLELGREQGAGLVRVTDPSTGALARLLVADGGGRVEIAGRSEKTAAMLAATPNGGTVRVFGPDATPVGGLIASAKGGGGLALTGPAGGESVVSLGANPSGGTVKVFATGGGPARAELSADGPRGEVTAYNQAGHPAVSLRSGASGSGVFELMDAEANIMVQAGTGGDGVGIVRAGPRLGGPAGSLAVPWAIMGRK